MTIISGSINTNLYTYTSSTLSDQDDTETSSSKKKETGSTSNTGDTITLSSEVTTARKREYLGLSPTGRLTLADFEVAASDRKDTVDEMLASAFEKLGIEPDQMVGLSLDDDGNIDIECNFKERSELEDVLNEDDDFMKAFRGLSANNEVLDYIDSVRTKTGSLLDYMDPETSDEYLTNLAAKQSFLNSGGSPIETVWRLSRVTTPYVYTYNAAE